MSFVQYHRTPRQIWMRMFALLVAPLLITLTGCNRAPKEALAPPPWLQGALAKPLGEVRIGFASLGTNVNAYTAAYADAFAPYGKRLGVQTIVLDGQADPSRQANQIQDLIAQQVDVIVVWPVNAKSVIPSVKSARAAGIPIVITNSPIDPSGEAITAGYSGPDSYAQARSAAQLMADQLGRKGNVVMIGGTPGYTASEDRARGFLDYMKTVPGIVILDNQPADWSREKAQSLMENYITRFGERIDGVYSADSGMGMGALAAAKAKMNKKLVFTDATMTAAAYDAIKAGDYTGSVEQSPIEDAETALRTAVLVAEGRKIPRRTIFETPIVTQATVASVKRPVF